MSRETAEADETPPSLTVRNIGGIEERELTLSPGVTLLTGRNATNRTSALEALGGVLGGSTATLKSDADEGYVSLHVDGEEYYREYVRTGGSVSVDGDPYVDDETLVDSFVALLETNPARTVVQRGGDLRDLVMRPVDTDEITARIATLRERKERVESELEEVRRRREELPSLEQKRTRLHDDIADLEAELSELRDRLDDHEGDVGAAREASAMADELQDVSEELSQLDDRLEIKRAERDALQDDLEDAKAELASLPDDPSSELSSITSDLESARSRKRDLEEVITSLTTIVSFNEEQLDAETSLPAIESDDDVTAALAPDDQRRVVCWTCGSEVQRGDVRDRLDDLRSVIEEKRAERADVDERIRELRERKRELESVDAQRRKLQRRVEDIERKLENRADRIDDLTERREELRERRADLEAAVEDADQPDESELLETSQRIGQLEHRLERRREDLRAVEDEIADVESLPATSALESRREELQSDIETERNRIAELETRAVEAFNEHVNDLLETLDYENVARVWLERKTPERRVGGPATGTEFDLHVVRERADGTVYEDSVDTLSESERELVGLVVALAGYLVHDVHETVPFMLLDSLEAIDAERIATLVAYFASFVPHLVVALLPEDADVVQRECNAETDLDAVSFS